MPRRNIACYHAGTGGVWVMSEHAVMQTTLARSTRCTGVGLHSGEKTRLILRPASAGTGIVVRRTDIAGPKGLIAVSADAVTDTRLCTRISNAHGASVGTVEHVFAALSALGVDNVRLDIDGPEIPALDGSAAPFMALIRRAGLRALPARRRVLKVVRPVEVRLGESWARFEPADRLELDVTIDFDRGGIGRQRVVAAVEPAAFAEDIAAARTFAFAEEVDALRAAGLALGGSFDNCVVLDGDAVTNPGGLRFADEFVRHKALDAVGDLYVAGLPIEGRFIAERPGHTINNALLRKLMADCEAHRIDWARQDTAGGRRAASLTGETRAAAVA